MQSLVRIDAAGSAVFSLSKVPMNSNVNIAKHIVRIAALAAMVARIAATRVELAESDDAILDALEPVIKSFCNLLGLLGLQRLTI